MDCIFCRIIEGSAPAEIVYRDDQVIAFQNLHQIAPVHLLVTPILHLSSMNDCLPVHDQLIGHMAWVAAQLAKRTGIDQSGYRLVINTGPDGGQSVFHIHLHLVGGRYLPFSFD